MHDQSGVYANQDLISPQELEAKRTNSSKELLLCHLNINSIQNKFDELVDVIHKLKAHIIFIGETKIDSTYPNSQFNIPGYTLFRNDRKKGGGGILAFVSAVIPCKRLKFNRTYKCIEAIALEITVGRREMVMIGMYRPPRALTGNYQLALEDELSHICNWASLQKGIVAVIGDLNLDRLRPNRSEGKLIIDLESEQGFKCLIKEPTRIERKGATTTSTLIDVLLTNRSDMFMQCGTYDTALSDHLLIYGLMKETVKRYQNKIITFRNYKNCDMEVFTNELATAPWHVGDLFDDVDDQEFYWKTMMNDIVDECFPLKKMRVRSKDVPYMTTSWKNAIRAKRRAAAKYYNDKSAHNWEVKQRCRNEATRQRRIAIKQYWKKKANDLTTNPKEFFKTFKPFLGSKTCTDKQAEINLKVNGTVVCDQTTVAETLARHFATLADSIGGDRAQQSEKQLCNHPSLARIRSNCQNEQVITVEPTNTTQVLCALQSLKTNKATGNDTIPAKVLKLGAKELATPLTKLYNSCISSGKWPSEWKRGEWIPVFKKDDPLDKENYRPVTVLSTVDKVFEQLISKQITSQFESRLSDCITAYRKSHSCETTLVSLVEQWKRARDGHQCVAVLSTDMSKAFDSLHPRLMLNKLRAYGFEENTVNLLRSYLSNPQNRIRMGSQTSSWQVINGGCPQGSALGPLLWNIFQNDLAYEIKSNLSMYADDHQIYEAGKDLANVKSSLSRNADKASNWYEDNMLKGNYNKYKTMTVQNKREITNLTMSVQGNEIESTEKLNLLGVTIDSKLNFNHHINNVCKKASQRIGVLMRLKNLIPTEAKLQLYKAAILPHLTYCHLTWHFCKASDRRKLERVQERGLRTVFKDKQSCYEELLTKANIPSLYNRRLQDIAIFMYKIKHKLLSERLCNLFQLDSGLYNLRKREFVQPRFSSVTYGKHSLRYLGPKLWNDLTPRLRNLPSLKQFKNVIRDRDLTALAANVSDCRGCNLCQE